MSILPEALTGDTHSTRTEMTKGTEQEKVHSNTLDSNQTWQVQDGALSPDRQLEHNTSHDKYGFKLPATNLIDRKRVLDTRLLRQRRSIS
jgi:hypothetical protein